MTFVALDIETDPEAIAEAMIEFIQERFPDYVGAPGNLDRLIIDANAEEAAVQRFQLQEMSEESVRVIGTIVGVPPHDPTHAVGITTWTFSDSNGRTIPAGADIALTGPDGAPVAFTVSQEIVVPNGSSSSAAVPIEAIEEGSQGSGLSGAAELLSDVAGVVSVTVNDVTTGGSDGETGDEFLDRWADRMQLLADRLIHADDFALFYRTAIDGCARAVAIDGYNPNTQTYDNEGTITVVGIEAEGQPLSGSIKTTAAQEMASRTVSGLIIYIADPTYTAVDVTAEVVSLPNYDLDELATQVTAAIEEYLDPANWGSDPTGTDGAAWLNEPVVRYLEVAETINRVAGVHYIVEPTLKLNTLYNTDVTLLGVAPLTEPGTVTVTVHAYGYDPSSS